MAVGQALQHVLEVGGRLDAIELCGGQEGRDDGPALCPTSDPANRWFLRPSAMGRMARSTVLLLSSIRSSRASTQSRPVLVRPRPGSSTGIGVSRTASARRTHAQRAHGRELFSSSAKSRENKSRSACTETSVRKMDAYGAASATKIIAYFSLLVAKKFPVLLHREFCLESSEFPGFRRSQSRQNGRGWRNSLYFSLFQEFATRNGGNVQFRKRPRTQALPVL